MRGDKRNADIKAPDGYLLGGIRRVRGDGTVLFQRDYWKAPAEWIGQDVWVHCMASGGMEVEMAPPGVDIVSARVWNRSKIISCELADRPSAKPGYRRASHKAYAERMRTLKSVERGERNG